MHNVLGFYASWFAIFIAVTGLVWGFQVVSISLYILSHLVVKNCLRMFILFLIHYMEKTATANPENQLYYQLMPKVKTRRESKHLLSAKEKTRCD